MYSKIRLEEECPELLLILPHNSDISIENFDKTRKSAIDNSFLDKILQRIHVLQN